MSSATRCRGSHPCVCPVSATLFGVVSQKNLSRHVLRLEEYQHGDRAPPNSWVLLERKQSAEDAAWTAISPRQAADAGEDDDEDAVDCIEYDDADSDPLRVQIDAVD